MDFKLEDSTCEKIPPKLEEIILGIIRKRTETRNLDLIQKDIFLTLIVYIMTENGFVLVNKEMDKKYESNMDNDQLSTLILCTEKCDIDFYLTGFSDIPVKLILCALGVTILVNGFINDVNSEVYSICLPINQYVVSPEASTVPMIFSNLKQLSYIFKNKIVTPVKSLILSYCGYSSASLLGLPEEILYKIFLSLPINDILNVSQTCKRLALLLEDPCFWHKLFFRDFKKEVLDEKHSWKILYKEAYIIHIQDSRRKPYSLRCRTGTLHDLMDFSDFVSYIDNPLWDIVL